MKTLLCLLFCVIASSALAQEAPIDGSTQLGSDSGIYESNWFGRYEWDGSSPWIHHRDHGWLLIAESWMYAVDLGWLYVTEANYPSVFWFRGERWITYQLGSRGPRDWWMRGGISWYQWNDWEFAALGALGESYHVKMLPNTIIERVYQAVFFPSDDHAPLQAEISLFSSMNRLVFSTEEMEGETRFDWTAVVNSRSWILWSRVGGVGGSVLQVRQVEGGSVKRVGSPQEIADATGEPVPQEVTLLFDWDRGLNAGYIRYLLTLSDGTVTERLGMVMAREPTESFLSLPD